MTSEIVFRIAQALIFLVFVIHRAYYNRKYPPEEKETIEAQPRSRMGVVANLLAIPALISLLLYIINPEWMAWASLPLPSWIRWAGILIAIGGFALLQWSHYSLGRNWSDQPRITHSQTLTISGPYRWIRHPIYTSFLFILGTPLLITANWFIGLLWLFITIIDIRERIEFEEAKLQARFGEAYESYMMTTGRLFPRLRP